jgi:hypothetical protein
MSDLFFDVKHAFFYNFSSNHNSSKVEVRMQSGNGSSVPLNQLQLLQMHPTIMIQIEEVPIQTLMLELLEAEGKPPLLLLVVVQVVAGWVVIIQDLLEPLLQLISTDNKVDKTKGEMHLIRGLSLRHMGV